MKKCKSKWLTWIDKIEWESLMRETGKVEWQSKRIEWWSK